LNQHIKEICEKHETERNQLKEIISQLQLQVTQQKQQYEKRIEAQVQQKAKNNLLIERQESDQIQAERQAMSQKLAENSEKLRSYEVQIQNLHQEKVSHEQKSKDLEMYIETTVKNQMKGYEDQIKVLQESLQQDRIKLNQENAKDSQVLHLQTKKPENPKKKGGAKKKNVEEDYEKKLQKVVPQLNKKFKQLFKFEAVERRLKVSISGNKLPSLHLITDPVVKSLSEEIIETLGRNNLFDLFGLELDLSCCIPFTDKALADVAKMLSNESLHLQYLNLGLAW